MNKYNVRLILLSLLLIFVDQSLLAQNAGQIIGKVQDKNSQELLAGATVFLENTTTGTQTDSLGRFKLQGITPGSYNLKIQYVGYVTKTIYNIVVSTGNIQTFNIDLETDSKSLSEVVVQSRTFGKRTETPLSIQSLTSEEIKSNPGGNFDISRVIQALPGVAGNTGGASFRNDIIIRGGGPNENVFYLDGIEIPVINHFSTQGSSGGPQGILNVSFIEDVTLASSSFGAKIDNALSSAFTFKQKEGNNEKVQGNIRLSASEFALTMDGPISKNTTFLASARRSYLEFLFMALDIPIRPNYWDFQYKTTTRLNDKTTLTTLGVGAIDLFKFGVPKQSSPEKEYILRNSPFITQWNYTIGAILKRTVKEGFVNVSLSRNMFNNAQDRWQDGQTNDESKHALKYRSQEMENKFRVDVNKYHGSWSYSYGLLGEYVSYNNATYAKINNGIMDSLGNVIMPPLVVNFNTAMSFFKGGAFGEATRRFFNDRFKITFGIRTDVNTFTDDGKNPAKTVSPRLSASYALTEKWNINATAGRYYKIPIYTILGFQDSLNRFVNKDNRYIGCNHYVLGLEFLPKNNTRITLEGFYKQYDNYPVSQLNGISLANQGADFAVLGNERTLSTGKGRTYGAELFFQQKLNKNIYATISYTYYFSQFTGTDNTFVPSAWDNRHLLSAILGYKFKKGWELGMKYRFAGGAPYTPFDMAASQTNYLTTGGGSLDYAQLNTLRLKPFNEFDIRLDKKINFKRTSLDLYIDIQNALAYTSESPPYFTFVRTADNTAWKTTDGKTIQNNGANATPLILNNTSATVLPTIGFIWEF